MHIIAITTANIAYRYGYLNEDTLKESNYDFLNKYSTIAIVKDTIDSIRITIAKVYVHLWIVKPRSTTCSIWSLYNVLHSGIFFVAILLIPYKPKVSDSS